MRHGFRSLLWRLKHFEQKAGTTWGKANRYGLNYLFEHGWLTVVKRGRYRYLQLTAAGEAELERCEAEG